jgi:hypothetical protein
MNNQAMANKGWFLHIGGQPQGPFTADQVAAKFNEGVVNRDSHVWCEGMPAWSTCKDVPDLASIFSGPSSPPALGVPPLASSPPLVETPSRSGLSGSTSTELSHLIELNPHEVDDTTAAIDPAKLRSAKKEAAVALKTERKITVANSVVGVTSGGSETPRRFKVLILAVPLIGFAAVGGAVGLKLVSVADIKSHTLHFVTGLTSTFPALDDVSQDQYENLRAAADSDVKTSGSLATIAISKQSEERPVFYVAANLPDGANLSFQLKADSKSALTDKAIAVRFPLTISKHLAKSPSLHTPDGASFPPGEYTATVVSADEEQPPEVKEILSKSKLFVTQKFFLGGQKDATFNSKLDQLHQKQKEKSLVEYKQGALLMSKLEAQVTLASDASQQIQNAKKSAVSKLWNDYDQKWSTGDVEPLEKGVYYPDAFAAIHEIWAQGKKIHELQSVAAQGGDWSQASALVTDTQQKLTALKTRLDAIAREVGASNADPAPGH